MTSRGKNYWCQWCNVGGKDPDCDEKDERCIARIQGLFLHFHIGWFRHHHHQYHLAYPQVSIHNYNGVTAGERAVFGMIMRLFKVGHSVLERRKYQRWALRDLHSFFSSTFITTITYQRSHSPWPKTNFRSITFSVYYNLGSSGWIGLDWIWNRAMQAFGWDRFWMGFGWKCFFLFLLPTVFLYPFWGRGIWLLKKLFPGLLEEEG